MTHGLKGRVVIPLIRRAELRRNIRDLNPIVDVPHEPYLLLTQELLTLPAAPLRSEIASLAAYQDEITTALDVLFGAGR
jgi:hypothetical protein